MTDATKLTILALTLLLCFQVSLTSAGRTKDDQSVKETFTCPPYDGFFPFPGECTGNYYSCINGEAFILKCPGNSIFDPNVGVCVPSEVASCQQITTTESTPFTCPTESGFYAVPGQCTGNYYSCINSQPYLLTCPGNSIFDPAQSVCVPEQEASCRDSSSTTTTGSSSSTTSRTTTSPGTGTTSSPGEFNCPSNSGIYPVPGVPCSNQFWKCSNGFPYLMTCPPPTIYNPALTICDWPYNVPGCSEKKRTAKKH